MHGDFTTSERKKIRQLADLAWERELRDESRKIAVEIEEMENGWMSPFDVNDRILIGDAMGHAMLELIEK